MLLLGTPVAALAIGTYSVYRLNTREEYHSVDSVTAPLSPIQEAVALKDKGNKFFKGSKYEQAIECYTKAIETCPDTASTELSTFYQNRAAAFESLGRIEAAIDDCSTALKHSPKYLKALTRRAKLYERTGQHQASLIDATAVTIFEVFSNIDNILFMERVLTHIANQKAELAKENMSPHLPSDSFIRNYFTAFSWDPLICQNSDLIKSAFHDEFRLPFDELQHLQETLSPDNPAQGFIRALHKAVSLLRREEFEASFHEIDNIFRDFPHSSSCMRLESEEMTRDQVAVLYAFAQLLRATFLALTGNSKDANDLLDDILKLHQQENGIESIISGRGESEAQPLKKQPMVVLVKVNALIKKACLVMTTDQDVARCLSTFQQAEQLCAQCPDVFLHRGQIAILVDKFDDALNDFNRAIKLQPDSSVARGQCIFASYRKAIQEGDMERAYSRMEEFKKLASKYPKCIETRSLYAQILVEKMAFTDADNEFCEVLKLCPDSGILYGHRAMLQLRWKQDREAATKILKEGLKQDEKCVMLHEVLGQLALEVGDFDMAIPELEKAVSLTSSEAELRHLLALLTGANAQKEVCALYGISKEEIKAWHQTCQEKMMAAMQSYR